MIWALDGQVAARAGAVVSPTTRRRRSRDVLAVCNEARIPVTAAAGRSGVCGASVPLHGGVVLDLCGLTGIVDVDATSLVLDVAPGTFGDHLEHELRTEHGLTLGHWPQSVALSTVGGWLACRSAGQLSTRYGKIEDMVLGPRRGPRRRAPDLHRRRARARPSAPTSTSSSSARRAPSASSPAPGCASTPRPPTSAGAAYAFASFEDGLDAMRGSCSAAARRPCCGSTTPPRPTAPTRPATGALLLVLDEGELAAVDAHDGARGRGVPGRRATPTSEHVAHWLEHRNDVAALEALISRGYVVDTMEVVGRWRDLPAHLRRHHRGAQRRRGHAVGVGPPVAQLHRRRLPLLHLRGQDGARRPRPLLPRGVGRRHPRRPRRRRRAVPPPRRRASTAAASWPRRSARPSTCSSPPRPPSTPTASSTPASSGCPSPFGPPGY